MSHAATLVPDSECGAFRERLAALKAEGRVVGFKEDPRGPRGTYFLIEAPHKVLLVILGVVSDSA